MWSSCYSVVIVLLGIRNKPICKCTKVHSLPVIFLLPLNFYWEINCADLHKNEIYDTLYLAKEKYRLHSYRLYNYILDWVVGSSFQTKGKFQRCRRCCCFPFLFSVTSLYIERLFVSIVMLQNFWVSLLVPIFYCPINWVAMFLCSALVWLSHNITVLYICQYIFTIFTILFFYWMIFVYLVYLFLMKEVINNASNENWLNRRNC